MGVGDVMCDHVCEKRAIGLFSVIFVFILKSD